MNIECSKKFPIIIILFFGGGVSLRFLKIVTFVTAFRISITKTQWLGMLRLQRHEI